MKKMTDKKLNYELAMAMGWKEMYRPGGNVYGGSNSVAFPPYSINCCISCLGWDPCNNYNHTRVVEEWIFSNGLGGKWSYETPPLELLRGTARERMEAAYELMKNYEDA